VLLCRFLAVGRICLSGTRSGIRIILNIKVTVVGDVGQLERGGYLIISNHVSYVDGFVLISIFPMVRGS
jgi:1-acyl-sn-glycerol-3-phosphate acyltransferase